MIVKTSTFLIKRLLPRLCNFLRPPASSICSWPFGLWPNGQEQISRGRQAQKVTKLGLVLRRLNVCQLTPFLLLPLSLLSNENHLFYDLCLVESINKKINDQLPFVYNYSLLGGYFNMPSARMQRAGTFMVGGGTVPPYNIYGINIQPFDHLELSGNYRVFKSLLDPVFGSEGFGNYANRIGNVKFGLLPEDGLPNFWIAAGADDFIGSGNQFDSQYVVATRQWLPLCLETSLGCSKGRIKGLFGGLIWSPFYRTSLFFLKNLSFVAEYDAINYKRHLPEHPDGRSVSSRINTGLVYQSHETLQLAVSSIRGEKVGASAMLHYPLGTSEGLLKKKDDPAIYTNPVDLEPLGVYRPEREFAQELAYNFDAQGLDLFEVYLFVNCCGKQELWLKIVNNRYREERDLRARLQHLLAALAPENIEYITVVIEADALISHSYQFRTEDLRRYHCGIIGDYEMTILSPQKEVTSLPPQESCSILFHKNKRIWTFTVRPQFNTYFGSAKGKFKYAVGMLASIEGYIFNEIYYNIQPAYSIYSTISDMSISDRINPSKIINVRTDSILYYQKNRILLEQAYLQKNWNMRHGFFSRIAAGYFEVAYGGVSSEFLYYPVGSAWAFGIDGACLLKRRYEGFQFTTHVRRCLGNDEVQYVDFVGAQGFLSVYYSSKPLDIDFKLSGGQFLARDRGVRGEASHTFKNGTRLGLWYTMTNAHDKVNGSTYFDKGFVLSVPLDLFLVQSSRTYVTYAMSAWLRDIGAKACTGKELYLSLREERVSP